MTKPRDLPRRAAPVLLGGFDVASGLAGLLSRHAGSVAGYAKAMAFMPLAWWWVGFIIVGVIVLIGIRSVRAAHASAAISTSWWLFWSAFAFLSLGAGVSARAVANPIGIAALHLLTMPYRRRQGR